MAARSEAAKNKTTSERTSDRELVVTRTIDAPARLVFEAWTTPEMIKRWWAPKSIGIQFVSCEADVRVGGKYRFVFSHPSAEQPMAFFGTYLEVKPHERIVCTNEEAGDAGQLTTVTFEEKNGQTRVVVHDLYPSNQALDDAIASGSTMGMDERYDQLDALLVTLA